MGKNYAEKGSVIGSKLGRKLHSKACHWQSLYLKRNLIVQGFIKRKRKNLQMFFFLFTWHFKQIVLVKKIKQIFEKEKCMLYFFS